MNPSTHQFFSHSRLASLTTFSSLLTLTFNVEQFTLNSVVCCFPLKNLKVGSFQLSSSPNFQLLWTLYIVNCAVYNLCAGTDKMTNFVHSPRIIVFSCVHFERWALNVEFCKGVQMKMLTLAMSSNDSQSENLGEYILHLLTLLTLFLPTWDSRLETADTHVQFSMCSVQKLTFFLWNFVSCLWEKILNILNPKCSSCICCVLL